MGLHFNPFHDGKRVVKSGILLAAHGQASDEGKMMM
jgi:hypothetical protein